MLLKVGAYVNRISKNNTIALLEASMTNYMSCVKGLAQAGSDVNRDLICDRCIKTLIKVGANVNTVEKEGNTPLIWGNMTWLQFLSGHSASGRSICDPGECEWGNCFDGGI